MAATEHDASGIYHGVAPEYVPVYKTSAWWESLEWFAEAARVGGAVVLPSGEFVLVRHPQDAKVLGGWFMPTWHACMNLRRNPSDPAARECAGDRFCCGDAFCWAC